MNIICILLNVYEILKLYKRFILVYFNNYYILYINNYNYIIIIYSIY